VKPAQLVPFDELHAGSRLLRADGVAPPRVEQVFPALRRIGRLDLVGVVGNATEGHGNPKEISGGWAQVLRRIGRRLRRGVLLVPALSLKIDGGADFGVLYHVDREAIGGPLGQDLAVQRTGLGTKIAGLDLGEVLVERPHYPRRGTLS